MKCASLPPSPLPPPGQWRLRVFGEVDAPRTWTLEQFRTLPRVKVFSDFHCVTTWSRLGNLWEGVSAAALLQPCQVRPAARFVVLHAYDSGWTTNLPVEDFLFEFLRPIAPRASRSMRSQVSADSYSPVIGSMSWRLSITSWAKATRRRGLFFRTSRSWQPE